MSISRQNVVKVTVYFERLEFNTITTEGSYSVSINDGFIFNSYILCVVMHHIPQTYLFMVS